MVVVAVGSADRAFDAGHATGAGLRFAALRARSGARARSARTGRSFRPCRQWLPVLGSPPSLPGAPPTVEPDFPAFELPPSVLGTPPSPPPS